MTDKIDVLPEVKEILGAVLFAAREPVGLGELGALFARTAERYGGVTRDYAAAGEGILGEALAALGRDLESAGAGVRLVEVAHGFRLETDTRCGPWLRQFLDKGRAGRLSKPALETLAIIAYRQPCTRAEIEAVRGVAVDQILRNLLDLQLVKIAGRSELPGRPWLLGTTQRFLEHFGLRNLDALPGVAELRRMEDERQAAGPGGAEEPAAPELPLGAEAAPGGGDERPPEDVSDAFASEGNGAHGGGGDGGVPPGEGGAVGEEDR